MLKRPLSRSGAGMARETSVRSSLSQRSQCPLSPQFLIRLGGLIKLTAGPMGALPVRNTRAAWW